jgi:hypothetical protein
LKGLSAAAMVTRSIWKFPSKRVLKAGYPGHPHRDNVAFPTTWVLKDAGFDVEIEIEYSFP